MTLVHAEVEKNTSIATGAENNPVRQDALLKICKV